MASRGVYVGGSWYPLHTHHHAANTTTRMNIEEISELIRDCPGCPLAYRGPGVAGAFFGNEKQSLVMVIGEAPGRQEQAQGRPFVGKAGKTMHRLFNEAGLTDYYATNVAKRQPGYRDRKQLAPSAAEIKLFEPLLYLEIKVLRPTTIIALGKVAALWCVRHKGSPEMGSLVNRWYDGEDGLSDHIVRAYSGKDGPLPRVLVLYHPSFINRMESKPWHARLEKEYRREVRKISGAKPQHYNVEENPWAQLRIRQDERVVVDVETTPVNPKAKDPDPRVDRLTGQTVLPLSGDTAYTYTNMGMNDLAWAGTKPVMWHAMFDLTVLARRNGMAWLRDLDVHDMMVGAYTLGWPDLSLKGYGESKGIHTVTFENRHEIGEVQYNGQDVFLTKMAMGDVLPRVGLAYEIDRHLIPAAVEMQSRGYYIDEERLEEAIRQYERVKQRMERMFYKAFPLLSPHAMEKEIWALEAEPGEKYNKTAAQAIGSPDRLAELWGLKDTRKETLTVKMAEGHPYAFEMGVVLQWRQATKRLTSYMYKMRESGRLTGLMKLTPPESGEGGTVTGRVAFTNGMQTQPLATQRALMAPDGMLLRRGDFAQIELMVAAQISQDKYLIGALNDPTRDLHKETRDALRLCGPTPCADVHCEHRTKAKNFNFGAGLYGGGSHYISSVVGCSVDEAADLMRVHRGLWRGWWGYAEEHWREVRRTGYSVEPITGHTRYISLLDEDDAYKQALNHPPQSGAAYIAKAAMYEGWRANWAINNQVHDAIHDWVPEDGDRDLQEEEMRSIMVETARRFLPDMDVRVDVKISKHWDSEEAHA